MAKKLQDKKKKERERKVHNKILAKRLAIRSERKIEQTQQALYEFEYETKNGKSQPIISNPEVAAAREARRREEIKAKLQHNVELLAALEAEYDKEQELRKAVNAGLEEEGATSIKEKLNLLHQKAIEMQNCLSSEESKEKDSENSENV